MPPRGLPIRPVTPSWQGRGSTLRLGRPFACDGGLWRATGGAEVNVREVSSGRTFLVTTVLNWFEELKQRVPTGG